MPLSWLPLISDYTREAKEPVKATAVSAVVYGIVSCWMYVIGMGAAIFTGESDIAQIMVKAGLGIAGLLIIVFSTVTTTFLDAYSAGISSESLSGKAQAENAAVAVTVIGIVGAYPVPHGRHHRFPLFHRLCLRTDDRRSDRRLFHPEAGSQRSDFDWRNLVVWFVGFVIYRMLMKVDLPVGNTLPDMVITAVLCCLIK